MYIYIITVYIEYTIQIWLGLTIKLLANHPNKPNSTGVYNRYPV